MYTAPTVAQFQAYFVRDFPYGTDPKQCVVANDIINAFNMVDLMINPCMWGGQTAYSIGYFYLAAHYLVLNLRASSQGLNGQYTWLQNSKGVGGVNESFSIPQRILDHPVFSQLSKTQYGARYLELLMPQLVGNIFTVPGRTKP